ncbi:hypothetical protein ACFWFQ_26560, partial [Nocardia salmonicida]|uniref:hypothetical protein n=1 Tax=Nocardia salmonicida TaxID=53431 RepID=UPI00365808E6
AFPGRQIAVPTFASPAFRRLISRFADNVPMRRQQTEQPKSLLDRAVRHRRTREGGQHLATDSDDDAA